MEKFNVVFSSDDQYVQHLTAALCSMLENTKYAHSIIVNILDGGIKENNKMFLTELTHRYGAEIEFLKINHELLKDVVVNGHITEATYYRILIPALFDESVEKAVYLDCDLLVRDDIYKFWSVDIDNCALGAIKVNEYIRHEQLGIPQSATYFNAGVLLINMKKWREESIIEKVLKFIVQYPERLKMWDQDALNGVLYDDWLEIDYTWNLRAQVFNLDYQAAGFRSEAAFEKTKNDPAIVHFTTASKPWHYLNNHRYKDEYFKYLDFSKYKYLKFPEKEFLLNRKMVVFGTGKGGELMAQRLLSHNIDVDYFVDNNQEKWGKELRGKLICNPTMLGDENEKFIIIASQYDNEIAEQLGDMGFKEGKHFLKNVDWNTQIVLA